MKKNYRTMNARQLVVAGIKINDDVDSYVEALVEKHTGDESYTVFLQNIVRDGFLTESNKDILSKGYQEWTRNKSTATDRVDKRKTSPTYKDLFNYVNRTQRRLNYRKSLLKTPTPPKNNNDDDDDSSKPVTVKQLTKENQQALAREARAKVARDKAQKQVKTLGLTVGSQKRDIKSLEATVKKQANEIDKLKKINDRLAKELATSEEHYQRVVNDRDGLISDNKKMIHLIHSIDSVEVLRKKVMNG